MKWLLSAIIRGYQKYVSPNLAPRCRYYPSCSEYGLRSIEVHGALKGTLLAIWRILRCNPWSKGGVDHVPDKGAWPAKPLGHAELMSLREQRDPDHPDTTRHSTPGPGTASPMTQRDTDDEPTRKDN